MCGRVSAAGYPCLRTEPACGLVGDGDNPRLPARTNRGRGEFRGRGSPHDGVGDSDQPKLPWWSDNPKRPAHGRSSALDADHLAERVHDPYEIVLRRHDGVDVLVRGRRLVEDARVLAAFDTARLALEVLERETVLRLAAAHPAARA